MNGPIICRGLGPRSAFYVCRSAFGLPGLIGRGNLIHSGYQGRDRLGFKLWRPRSGAKGGADRMFAAGLSILAGRD